MIEIYTDYEEFDIKKILLDNDSFFNINVTARDFSELEEDTMRVVDNAELLDRETGAIKTKRGITNLENLSTGCKTILNYLFILKNCWYLDRYNAIDISSCGNNAIEQMFKVAEKFDGGSIPLILRHKDKVHKCGKREYLVDGRMLTDLAYID